MRHDLFPWESGRAETNTDGRTKECATLAGNCRSAAYTSGPVDKNAGTRIVHCRRIFTDEDTVESRRYDVRWYGYTAKEERSSTPTTCLNNFFTHNGNAATPAPAEIETRANFRCPGSDSSWKQDNLPTKAPAPGRITNKFRHSHPASCFDFGLLRATD